MKTLYPELCVKFRNINDTFTTLEGVGLPWPSVSPLIDSPHQQCGQWRV